MRNESGNDRKLSDDELLKAFSELCVDEKCIVTEIKLRKAIREGRFPRHTLLTRFGGMNGAQASLLSFAIQNKCDQALRVLPGWRIDVNASSPTSTTDSMSARPRLFGQVCKLLDGWSPPLRRSSEETYKAEIANHLKQKLKTTEKILEERGETTCDIAVGLCVGIETKKSPTLAEYDRCFGQVARHLDVFEYVAIVILDVKTDQHFEAFCERVDKYFGDRALVIRSG